MKLKPIRHKLYSGSFITLISLGIGNFLNLIFLLTMSRYFSPTQFGNTQAILALNYFIAILLSGLSFSYIYHFHQLKNSQVSSAIHHLEKSTLKWLIIIFLLCLISIPLLSSLFPSLDHTSYLLFISQALLAFISIIYLSLLQAKLHFIQYGIAIIVSALVKSSSLILLLQFKINSLAPFISLILFFLTIILISKLFTLKLYPSTASLKTSLSAQKFWRYSSLALVTSLYITILTASDLILTSFFLNSISAGVFAAIASTGKIIYFTSAAVITVLFPLSVGLSLNRAKILFWQAILLTSLLCLVLAAILISSSPYISLIFHHPSYFQVANHLPSYLLVVIITTLSVLSLQFLLALKQKLICSAGLLATICYLTPILIFHQDIHQLISSLIIGSLMSFIIIFSAVVYTLYHKKS